MNGRRKDRAQRWSIRVLLSALIVAAVSQAASPVRLNDRAEGQKLAAEMRKLAPSSDGQVTGTLRISSPGQPPRVLPLKSSVIVSSTNWLTIYEVRPSDAPPETLIIRHTPGKPNEYEWRRGNQVLTPAPNAATNRFGGSDFVLLDLGLEFFHWPTQSLAFREMRKGRGCDVLESRPAAPIAYSAVFSWIDQDTRAQGQPGLLMAEALDSQGKLVKEFEVRKITREGELREIELRNRQTKSTTRIQFDSAAN
jgi:hypothetical protein